MYFRSDVKSENRGWRLLYHTGGAVLGKLRDRVDKAKECLDNCTPLRVFTPLRGKHCIYFKADDLNPFYGCGTWDDEGLAEAHDELDGREEEEAEERLLTRLGMSELRGL